MPRGGKATTCGARACVKSHKNLLKREWDSNHEAFLFAWNKQYDKNKRAEYLASHECALRQESDLEKRWQRQHAEDLAALKWVIRNERKKIMQRDGVDRCSKCKTIVPVEMMARNRSKWCKPCVHAWNIIRRKTHPEVYRAARRRQEARMKANPTLLIRQRIRGRISKAVKMHARGLSIKGSKLRYLGCTASHAVEHLQSLFTEGMSWSNYGQGIGKWNVDHITPISYFDLRTEKGRHAAFNYENMQPMWSIENTRKNNHLRLEA